MPIDQTLEIDRQLFCQAFGRDADFNYDGYVETTYLDRESGDLELICERDEDSLIGPEENRESRCRVREEPARYIEISGLSHGEHHKILKRFLDSPWTTDTAQLDNARTAYFSSIGGWRKTVDDEEAITAYEDFKYEETQRLAEEFLRDHGIDVVWTP